MNENIENDFFLKFRSIIKGIFLSILITMVMLLILSALLCYTNISENLINPCIIFISTFSVLIGSFILMKNIKEKGLIYGMLLGIIYMLIIYLISSFISMDFSLGIGSIIMIILGIISGAVGGIIGVNIKL